MSSTSNEIKLFPGAAKPTLTKEGPAFPHKIERSMQIYVLQSDSSSIDRCLEILQWRFKTSLPIVRPLYFALTTPRQLSPQKHTKLLNRSPEKFQKNVITSQRKAREALNQAQQNQSASLYEVVIQIENIKFLLSDIKLLPFPQIVYLLKEMMIGYEVLVDIFGIFEPKDSMIAVNDTDQWKLWVNPNFTLNAILTPNISEKEFIYKLILIAENHCFQTTLSKRFFQQIKQITYTQECSFIMILQKIKDFAIINKVYSACKVVMPKDQVEKEEQKTLKKQKGFHRIQQMKSSLIDGRFIPKSTWTLQTERNKASVSSFESSPLKKGKSVRCNDGCAEEDKIHRLSLGWKAHNELQQYFTPREKVNTNPMQLYSPQVQAESQNSPIRPQRSTLNPRLNFTISNSIIERRRKSEQNKYCNSKLPETSEQINQQNEQNVYQQKRHATGIKYLTVNEKQAEDPKSDLIGSYNNSCSTQLRQSQHALATQMTYKNLKMNDIQLCMKPRNNQSSFVNIGIPNYQRNDNNKSLSISYQFRTKSQQNEKPEHEIETTTNRPWKNTISGLFSDTTTIRQLKTSIKIKTPNQKAQQTRYPNDVNLEVLSKMGRQARESFDEDDQPDIDREFEEMELAEQSKLWKNMHTSRDSQEDPILKKPTSSCNSPLIMITCAVRQKNDIFM